MELFFLGYFKVIFGEYWDSGKEHENHYSILGFRGLGSEKMILPTLEVQEIAEVAVIVLGFRVGVLQVL